MVICTLSQSTPNGGVKTVTVVAYQLHTYPTDCVEYSPASSTSYNAVRISNGELTVCLSSPIAPSRVGVLFQGVFLGFSQHLNN